MSDTNPSFSVQAEHQLMTAFLREVHGAQPAPDLLDRILTRAESPPSRADRARRLGLAAALLVAGVAVVAALVWQQQRAGARHAASPVDDPGAQDPQAKQDSKPEVDKELQARIDAAIAALASPDLRDDALQALAEIGTPAIPALDRALQVEANRARPHLLAALQSARFSACFFWAKTKPVEPFTLIADYSDNRVLAVNAKGDTLWSRNDVFGAWDAELTHAGTMLITQFAISSVIEIDARGKVVWKFETLKNPYDADRLANGNTLIADTFGSRVIEVDPAGKIVWEFKDNVRPFDCDRLENGNTLIADVLGARVIEVDRAGKIVWQHEGLRLVHDADRLPNGNTLITLREAQKVIEVDRVGAIVFTLENLSHPSDADRLPNGNTLVAENGMAREYDPQGREVWRREATWPVEVQRY